MLFFSAIVVSRIIYALSAWGKFLSNDLIAEYDAFLKKTFRWGYSCDLRRLYVLLHEADEHLFHKMVYNKDHCIHQLVPPEKILPMRLLATNCILLCLSVTITCTNVRLYCDICLFCILDFACRSVVALPYFISFYFILFFLLILYRFCYVMFCFAMAFDRCLIKDYLLT